MALSTEGLVEFIKAQKDSKYISHLDWTTCAVGDYVARHDRKERGTIQHAERCFSLVNELRYSVKRIVCDPMNKNYGTMKQKLKEAGY